MHRSPRSLRQSPSSNSGHTPHPGTSAPSDPKPHRVVFRRLVFPERPVSVLRALEADSLICSTMIHAGSPIYHSSTSLDSPSIYPNRFEIRPRCRKRTRFSSSGRREPKARPKWLSAILVRNRIRRFIMQHFLSLYQREISSLHSAGMRRRDNSHRPLRRNRVHRPFATPPFNE